MEKKYFEIYNFYLYFIDQASDELRYFMHYSSQKKIVDVLSNCTSIFEMNDAVSELDI